MHSPRKYGLVLVHDILILSDTRLFRILTVSSFKWNTSGIILQPFAEVDRHMMALTDFFVIAPILLRFAVLPAQKQVST
jgi:hypothetical protein